MKIISTNIGSPTTITWNGKEELTGIFKYPVEAPLFLGKTDVANDTVIDRKHHAGVNKACFLFSTEHYEYWKSLYPSLDWNWGMFGENLSVSNFDESVIRIGDIYKIGSALVQVSQPREPCYKLGIRFQNQSILKQYIDYGFPGTYVRILEEGEVKVGDELLLVEQSQNALTVKDFYQLLFTRQKDPQILQLALTNTSLPEYKRERLKKFLPKS
ncbi:MOSC domain-containing protein [Zobellia sp. 1_MG-2023]|uniref:MOSC domain-containing protein n=1 Tax=Zobellia sp. 1_MG-2023 TaxID=3062626 RepID=UPI00259405FD|nr:MOSC domain-containing protein [Zobellia sp. 1_MG-2023]MDO6820558.1 MOSC domain-containing protein [Zobellia sp. 1_MG-2023]